MINGIDRLVLIRLSGKTLAIDLSSVTEVTELQETWPIPLAPGFFKGAMNSHGSLIPLLDLASWMETGDYGHAGKTVVIDRRIADLAFLVDDVERVLPSSDATLLRNGEGVTVAVLEIDGKEVELLSVSAIVEMLEVDLQCITPRTFTAPGKAA